MTNCKKNAGILGVGLYMPEEIRTNDYWNDKEFLNLPPSKSKKDCFLGIDERRVFPKNMLPSEAEVKAGEAALKNANISKEEIDLVLVHSMVPNETVPGNASLVQYELGLKNAAAWNIDTCCSSFVTMFINASALIKSGMFKKILVITSIFHSKIIDENDYLTPYVGDGSSAVVVGEVPEEYGYITSHCTSNGYYHDAFTVRERLPLASKYRSHFEKSPLQNLMTSNTKKAREMGKKSLDYMSEVLFETLNKSDYSKSDLDFFLSHQPCHWAHDAWRDLLELSEDKSYQTFNIYGNIASTSIPASMYHALENNRIKKGDTILIASSGAGENHAAALFKWAI
ncbi:MAG: ketoacyl-ACP synthase III [Firmicutes bacterium]|nr:ketoacyl-ACP synthase III [Bacillota bacterium]